MNVADALDQLEQVIFECQRLLSWTLVKEEVLLERLDQIRESLPAAFEAAEKVLQQRDEIVQEAGRYARDIVANAERKAQQLLEESVIIRQAQAQAEQIYYQTQREGEDLRRQSLQEIEQLQMEANRYVDQVLGDLENRLLESLRIVRNGRQNL